VQFPWQVLCVFDTLKAALPGQRRLRLCKDRVIGYRRDASTDKGTIRSGLKIIEWAGDVQGRLVVEIGSGWQPMLPLLFALKGARVVLTDLHRLMRAATVEAALEALREDRETIIQALGIPSGRFEDVVRPGLPWKERFARLGLYYLAPCDCRRLPLSDGSVDLVYSRAVFEHVPPVILGDILKEAARVLRPLGRMIHIVDHSDHWSHRDPRLSRVNFLRYPGHIFRWTCLNSQNYQNRLRHSQYVELILEAGFDLLREEREVRPQELEALDALPLAPEFRHFEREDLAAISSTFLAAPAAGRLGTSAAG